MARRAPPGGRGLAGASVGPRDSRGLHAAQHSIGLHVCEVTPQVLLLLESLEQCVEVAGSKTLQQERGGELRV